MADSSPLDHLITLLGKMPGIGARSARRLALHLLKKKDTLLLPLAHSLQEVAHRVQACRVCGNWDTQDPCRICCDDSRLRSVVCVVEQVADVWALERSRVFRGQYHVLGGTLSALSDTTPDELRFPALLERCQQGEIREVILALSATVDGQTTSHYLAALLQETKIPVTRLAQGMPMGGELDYLDDGTLSAAMLARLPLDTTV